LTLRRGATDALSPAELAAIRRLMDEAFEGEFSDDDWDHSLGGTHVLVHDEDGTLLAHASVVDRLLEVDERPFRTGYVEAVAVPPTRQRQGHGARAMAEVAAILHEGYELGALGAAVPEFYEALGWERWLGPTYARDGIARLRTEEDEGWVMVLRFGVSERVDLAASLSCEVRSGDYW
jgi:aminoglycoside 2'-N-acetyltransferase I